MSQSDLGPSPDVVLIGAGIMSATFGVLLKALDPSLSITVFEILEDCGLESSDSWNNAGTGHAANCELNYTPQRTDGSIDISQALKVNTEFDVSRQFWAYLVTTGAIQDPGGFVHACPHMSLVWGEENVAFLRARYAAMSAHHCYHGMQFSDDRKTLADWAPLTMEGRDDSAPIAATRIVSGADVDYGGLTRRLFKHLSSQPGVTVCFKSHVTDLKREEGGRWRIHVRDAGGGGYLDVSAGFVFIGAGGGALELLQKSGIPEGHGYGGFPVSGIWLRCDEDAISARHHAKVYGKAPQGSPPMSVPHLDTRMVEGKRSLLFGPYAGFATKFLKHGSLTDLFRSIRPDNVAPLLEVAKDDYQLSEYLISQVLQSASAQFEMLKAFYPKAERHDWKHAVAGQRVQVIKPDPEKIGYLEFGTELISAADKSLIALLGASPGASTAAFIATQVLERCFSDRLTEQDWLPKVREIFPTWGIDLAQDAEACLRTREETAPVLKLDVA
jgi:malate dehydrogenase (quinone)